MSRQIEVWLISTAIRNTDDHLRNHGFLLSDHGWHLSPAYDLNPNPEGTGLSLNIYETDNALNFDLDLEVAPHFRLKPSAAEALLQEIRTTVRTWRDHARHLAIPRHEQEIMVHAFDS